VKRDDDLSQPEIDRLLESIHNEPNEIAADDIEAVKQRSERCRKLYSSCPLSSAMTTPCETGEHSMFSRGVLDRLTYLELQL